MELNKRNKQKLQATEMDFLRSCHDTIKQMTDVHITIIDRIEKNPQLIWYGHVLHPIFAGQYFNKKS